MFDGRTIYPARQSNAITKDYYYTVREMMLNGTTNLRVQKFLRRNGSHTYWTYHLITSP